MKAITLFKNLNKSFRYITDDAPGSHCECVAELPTGERVYRATSFDNDVTYVSAYGEPNLSYALLNGVEIKGKRRTATNIADELHNSDAETLHWRTERVKSARRAVAKAEAELQRAEQTLWNDHRVTVERS